MRRSGYTCVLVPFIDLQHLVVDKRASGRPQDLADAAALGEDTVEEPGFPPKSAGDATT